MPPATLPRMKGVIASISIRVTMMRRPHQNQRNALGPAHQTSIADNRFALYHSHHALQGRVYSVHTEILVRMLA